MIESIDLTPFAIFGLYRDRTNPEVILATDKADARLQYHARHPGWEGTTFLVKTLEEMTEEDDG